MNHRQLSRIIIFPVFFLLWGCFESPLSVQVRYAEVSGLTQDDSVYFEQNEIGKVQKVSYTQQGDYLVELKIEPNFKNAATVDSQFFIETDPKDQQGKVITILQTKPGGKILDTAVIVQGSVKAGFLDNMVNGFKRSAASAEKDMRGAMQQLVASLNETSRQMDQEMAGVLEDLSRQFQKFSEEVKKVPEKQEVKDLERAIRQLADEFHKAQKDVRDHIQNEVIPQLRRELDQLREQLHKEGRDQEIDEIDRQVSEMSRA